VTIARFFRNFYSFLKKALEKEALRMYNSVIGQMRLIFVMRVKILSMGGL